MKAANTIKASTLSLFLLTTFNITWQYYLFLEQLNIAKESGFDPPCDLGAWKLDAQSRLLLFFLTLIIFWGSRGKGIFRKICYFSGIAGGCLIYLFWWRESLKQISTLGAEEFVFPRTAYFGHGNYLDVCIALVLFALLLFETMISLFSVKSKNLH